MEGRFYAGTKDGKSLSIRRIDEDFQGVTININFQTIITLAILSLLILTAVHFTKRLGVVNSNVKTEKTSTVKHAQPVLVEEEGKNTDKPIQADKKEFIFPQSSTFLLSEKDIAALKASNDFQKDLRAAINEIYARNGFVFKTESIKKYYLQFDWYNPSKKEVSWEDFNQIEQANLALLISVEEENGFR